MLMTNARPAIRHALLAATALAGLPLTGALAEDAKWGPWIDAGGKIGSSRRIGEADLFLPLAQDGQSLLFLDLRGNLDNLHQREGNFGLGYRHMLDNGWNLGAYGFYDRRRSSTQHYFSQATVGIEALGPDFDARINGYVPLGRDEYEVPGTTRLIVDDASIRLSSGYERAYHGGDAELGWRVPLFAADDDTELRLYGGGYWFDASQSDAVIGPRARLEWRLYDPVEQLPGSRITLSGEIQRDEQRGTQEFFGFKLRLPLQPEGGTRRPTPQERRMVDPVVRDVDIVTRQAQISEAVKLEGQTVTGLRQLSGADLQGQLNSAAPGALLVLNGEATVTAPVVLGPGHALRSGGAIVKFTGASSGKTVAYTIPGGNGSIRGAVAGDAVVQMAPGSSLSNIAVQNTSAAANSWAVSASGATGASLNNVTMVSAGSGLRISNSDNVTVTGGSIRADQGHVADIGGSTGTALNNVTMTSSANGLRVNNSAGFTFAGGAIQAQQGYVVDISDVTGAMLTDIAMTSAGSGLRVSNSGNVAVTGGSIRAQQGYVADIAGNTNTRLNNIDMVSTDGGLRVNTSNNVTVTGGSIHAQQGYVAEISGGTHTTLNNVAMTSSANGLRVSFSDNVTVTGGSIQAGQGYVADIVGSMGATLNDVSMTSAASGLNATGSDNFTLRDSRITAAQGNAITAMNSSGLNIAGNTLVENGARGMGIRADNVSGRISGNTVTTNGNGNGLDDSDPAALPAHALYLNNSGGLIVADNTITTNGTQANGIHITNSAGIRISDNRVTTNNYMSRGIHLRNSNNATLSGNTVATNTLDDSNWSILTIAFGLLTQNSTNLTISGNTISTRMRGAMGINVRYGDNSTVAGNTVTTHGGSAHAVSIVRSTSNTVSGNTLTTTNPSTAYGLYFGAYSHNGFAENNTVTVAGAGHVVLYYADDVTVRNNRLVGRGDSGVNTSDSNGAVISGNTP